MVLQASIMVGSKFAFSAYYNFYLVFIFRTWGCGLPLCPSSLCLRCSSAEWIVSCFYRWLLSLSPDFLFILFLFILIRMRFFNFRLPTLFSSLFLVLLWFVLLHSLYFWCWWFLLLFHLFLLTIHLFLHFTTFVLFLLFSFFFLFVVIDWCYIMTKSQSCDYFL